MPAENDQKGKLYTIGHSNHDLAAFVRLLEEHGVKAIADVRSQPYSQFAPQFNREPLEQVLKARGIGYEFAGKELGARRAEAECYAGGKARYDLVARMPLFREGLERVRRSAQGEPVALMCAEKDPITCHRMVLVCRHLRGAGLEIRHILEDGAVETNEEAEGRLLALAGLPEEDLFQSRAELVEQAYDKQGEKIAYVEGAEAGAGQRQEGR